MAVEDAILALREHWGDVVALLPPSAAGELRSMIGELGGPGREAAVDQIIDILVEGLPARHVVRRALVKGDLSVPAVLDWDVLAAELLAQLTEPAVSGEGEPGPGAGGRDDEPPSVAQILPLVTPRLLAAPA